MPNLGRGSPAAILGSGEGRRVGAGSRGGGRREEAAGSGGRWAGPGRAGGRGLRSDRPRPAPPRRGCRQRAEAGPTFIRDTRRQSRNSGGRPRRFSVQRRWRDAPREPVQACPAALALREGQPQGVGAELGLRNASQPGPGSAPTRAQQVSGGARSCSPACPSPGFVLSEEGAARGTDLLGWVPPAAAALAFCLEK